MYAHQNLLAKGIQEENNCMGRFDEFELTIKKIRDFPLTYETIISEECSFFQDVRRYQSITSHLDVKVIAVDDPNDEIIFGVASSFPISAVGVTVTNMVG